MGLFKSMKDMASITKESKKLHEQQKEQQGYKSGMGGTMAQMGDMVSQAKDQLADLTDSQGERAQLLQDGLEGEGTIVGMGTPERGAQWFNMNIDLEVRVSGRSPYRVNNEYLVPASAKLGQGVVLPIRVDPNDQAKIAIDWESAAKPPAKGEIRPAGPGA